MFLKFALKSSPALALAACIILVTSNCAAAQTAVSFGKIRNLSAMDTQTGQETAKPARLIAINDGTSLTAP